MKKYSCEGRPPLCSRTANTGIKKQAAARMALRPFAADSAVCSEDAPDLAEIPGKPDPGLTLLGGQALFDHVLEQRPQAVVVPVQVIEDTGGIKLF